MKLSAAAREKMYPAPTLLNDTPRYPYGLTITLDNETLDKLEMGSLPKVGKTMTLIAAVTVTSVSSSEDSGDHEVRRNVSLQITDMALEGSKAAATLYEDRD